MYGHGRAAVLGGDPPLAALALGVGPATPGERSPVTGRSADPTQVVVTVATVLVTTDCCTRRMALPRERVDLMAAHRLVCLGCGRGRQVDFVGDLRVGVTAVWSDIPGARRWWRWSR